MVQVKVSPLQVIVQMTPSDWEVVLEAYREAMGEIEFKKFAYMLQAKLQAQAGV